MANLRYFLWCLLRLSWGRARYYHRAQKSLYGWPYLWGVRALRPDGEARYRAATRGRHFTGAGS